MSRKANGRYIQGSTVLALAWYAAWCSHAARADVSLSETEYAGLPHFQITTPQATYFLEKTGAGLSRLVDREGNDWLSFDPTPGSGAGGEFRGFPNAVHQQAGNHFHPRNQATDASHVQVVHAGRERVTTSAQSASGLWECRYDFLDTHCVFTMTKMPPDKKYWVLYEGTPGGQFDASDWWMTSAVKTRQPMSANHDGDIAGPEWIVFGDARLGRVLFLLHYEDDLHPDRFYAMQSKMTVFGFGRAGVSKFLDRVPQSFAIGLVESTSHAEISRAMAKLLRLQEQKAQEAPANKY
jgi:hypothetical protein